MSNHNNSAFLQNSFQQNKIIEVLPHIRQTLHIIQNRSNGAFGLLTDAEYVDHHANIDPQLFAYVGRLPPLYPEWLGDTSFLAAHHARFPYIVGEMANGIATAKMVVASVKAGMLGFFGAAGLLPEKIEENLRYIQAHLNEQEKSWGSNLIHSPSEPELEKAAVELYLRYNVQRVSASAYMALNPHIIQYACTGLTADANGKIHRRNFIFAKISRTEVAKQFMMPAPAQMLNYLVEHGKITKNEAELALHIPVAQDITAEADSGGHTDNRPLTALFPTIYQLAEHVQAHYQYQEPLRVGAAGGLGTPSAIAGAFTLGAAYVLTGSINQASVEGGISMPAKKILAQVEIADVMMAPAADMFELGVKLQITKRSSLFGSRANKLYEIYTSYDSLESIPATERKKLEEQIFKANLDDIWVATSQFFMKRDPAQIALAAQNPKHRMALVFRWYLGLSSQWAIQGTPERNMDYQIWCGPAMGAFNQWVAGSFLEDLSNRTVEQIGRNLLEGAATIMRAQQLRSFGLNVPHAAFDYKPRPCA